MQTTNQWPEGRASRAPEKVWVADFAWIRLKEDLVYVGVLIKDVRLPNPNH